jgi:toxin ParE1/3/4
LNEIWDYTEQHWGREQAYSYVSRLVADCRSVLAGDKPPQTFEHRSGTLLRVRSGTHAAFLSQAPDGLRVVRVIHLKRDVQAELD